MPTSHPRIGVVNDPELADALRRVARPLHQSGLRSEAGQVRRLALLGAAMIAADPAGARRRERLLEACAARPARSSVARLSAALAAQRSDRRGELGQLLLALRGSA